MGIINLRFAYPIKISNDVVTFLVSFSVTLDKTHVRVCARAGVHALIQTRFQKALGSHIKNEWTLKSVRLPPSNFQNWFGSFSRDFSELQQVQ